MKNQDKTINVSLSLTPRQAHLLSIVCALDITIPEAATFRSELLRYEQESNPGMEMKMPQRVGVRRALAALREALREATPSAHLAKTTEVFTAHPQGLV
jgi:hypothetical protein